MTDPLALYMTLSPDGTPFMRVFDILPTGQLDPSLTGRCIPLLTPTSEAKTPFAKEASRAIYHRVISHTPVSLWMDTRVWTTLFLPSAMTFSVMHNRYALMGSALQRSLVPSAVCRALGLASNTYLPPTETIGKMTRQLLQAILTGQTLDTQHLTLELWNHDPACLLATLFRASWTHGRTMPLYMGPALWLFILFLVDPTHPLSERLIQSRSYTLWVVAWAQHLAALPSRESFLHAYLQVDNPTDPWIATLTPQHPLPYRHVTSVNYRRRTPMTGAASPSPSSFMELNWMQTLFVIDSLFHDWLPRHVPWPEVNAPLDESDYPQVATWSNVKQMDALVQEATGPSALWRDEAESMARQRTFFPYPWNWTLHLEYIARVCRWHDETELETWQLCARRCMWIWLKRLTVERAHMDVDKTISVPGWMNECRVPSTTILWSDRRLYGQHMTLDFERWLTWILTHRDQSMPTSWVASSPWTTADQDSESEPGRCMVAHALLDRSLQQVMWCHYVYNTLRILRVVEQKWNDEGLSSASENTSHLIRVTGDGRVHDRAWPVNTMTFVDGAIPTASASPRKRKKKNDSITISPLQLPQVQQQTKSVAAPPTPLAPPPTRLLRGVSPLLLSERLWSKPNEELAYGHPPFLKEGDTVRSSSLYSRLSGHGTYCAAATSLAYASPAFPWASVWTSSFREFMRLQLPLLQHSYAKLKPFGAQWPLVYRESLAVNLKESQTFLDAARTMGRASAGTAAAPRWPTPLAESLATHALPVTDDTLAGLSSLFPRMGHHASPLQVFRHHLHYYSALDALTWATRAFMWPLNNTTFLPVVVQRQHAAPWMPVPPSDYVETYLPDLPTPSLFAPFVGRRVCVDATSLSDLHTKVLLLHETAADLLTAVRSLLLPNDKPFALILEIHHRPDSMEESPYFLQCGPDITWTESQCQQVLDRPFFQLVTRPPWHFSTECSAQKQALWVALIQLMLMPNRISLTSSSLRSSSEWFDWHGSTIVRMPENVRPRPHMFRIVTVLPSLERCDHEDTALIVSLGLHVTTKQAPPARPLPPPPPERPLPPLRVVAPPPLPPLPPTDEPVDLATQSLREQEAEDELRDKRTQETLARLTAPTRAVSSVVQPPDMYAGKPTKPPRVRRPKRHRPPSSSSSPFSVPQPLQNDLLVQQLHPHATIDLIMTELMRWTANADDHVRDQYCRLWGRSCFQASLEFSLRATPMGQGTLQIFVYDTGLTPDHPALLTWIRLLHLYQWICRAEHHVHTPSGQSWFTVKRPTFIVHRPDANSMDVVTKTVWVWHPHLTSIWLLELAARLDSQGVDHSSAVTTITNPPCPVDTWHGQLNRLLSVAYEDGQTTFFLEALYIWTQLMQVWMETGPGVVTSSLILCAWRKTSLEFPSFLTLASRSYSSLTQLWMLRWALVCTTLLPYDLFFWSTDADVWCLFGNPRSAFYHSHLMDAWVMAKRMWTHARCNTTNMPWKRWIAYAHHTSSMTPVFFEDLDVVPPTWFRDRWWGHPGVAQLLPPIACWPDTDTVFKRTPNARRSRKKKTTVDPASSSSDDDDDTSLPPPPAPSVVGRPPMRLQPNAIWMERCLSHPLCEESGWNQQSLAVLQRDKCVEWWATLIYGYPEPRKLDVLEWVKLITLLQRYGRERKTASEVSTTLPKDWFDAFTVALALSTYYVHFVSRSYQGQWWPHLQDWVVEAAWDQIVVDRDRDRRFTPVPGTESCPPRVYVWTSSASTSSSVCGVSEHSQSYALVLGMWLFVRNQMSRLSRGRALPTLLVEYRHLIISTWIPVWCSHPAYIPLTIYIQLDKILIMRKLPCHDTFEMVPYITSIVHEERMMMKTDLMVVAIEFLEQDIAPRTAFPDTFLSPVYSAVSNLTSCGNGFQKKSGKKTDLANLLADSRTRTSPSAMVCQSVNTTFQLLATSTFLALSNTDQIRFLREGELEENEVRLLPASQHQAGDSPWLHMDWDLLILPPSWTDRACKHLVQTPLPSPSEDSVSAWDVMATAATQPSPHYLRTTLLSRIGRRHTLVMTLSEWPLKPVFQQLLASRAVRCSTTPPFQLTIAIRRWDALLWPVAIPRALAVTRALREQEPLRPWDVHASFWPRSIAAGDAQGESSWFRYSMPTTSYAQLFSESPQIQSWGSDVLLSQPTAVQALQKLCVLLHESSGPSLDSCGGHEEGAWKFHVDWMHQWKSAAENTLSSPLTGQELLSLVEAGFVMLNPDRFYEWILLQQNVKGSATTNKRRGILYGDYAAGPLRTVKTMLCTPKAFVSHHHVRGPTTTASLPPQRHTCLWDSSDFIKLIKIWRKFRPFDANLVFPARWWQDEEEEVAMGADAPREALPLTSQPTFIREWTVLRHQNMNLTHLASWLCRVWFTDEYEQIVEAVNALENAAKRAPEVPVEDEEEEEVEEEEETPQGESSLQEERKERRKEIRKKVRSASPPPPPAASSSRPLCRYWKEVGIPKRASPEWQENKWVKARTKLDIVGAFLHATRPDFTRPYTAYRAPAGESYHHLRDRQLEDHVGLDARGVFWALWQPSPMLLRYFQAYVSTHLQQPTLGKVLLTSPFEWNFQSTETVLGHRISTQQQPDTSIITASAPSLCLFTSRLPTSVHEVSYAPHLYWAHVFRPLAPSRVRCLWLCHTPSQVEWVWSIWFPWQQKYQVGLVALDLQDETTIRLRTTTPPTGVASTNTYEVSDSAGLETWMQTQFGRPAPLLPSRHGSQRYLHEHVIIHTAYLSILKDMLWTHSDQWYYLTPPPLHSPLPLQRGPLAMSVDAHLGDQTDPSTSPGQLHIHQQECLRLLRDTAPAAWITHTKMIHVVPSPTTSELAERGG